MFYSRLEQKKAEAFGLYPSLRLAGRNFSPDWAYSSAKAEKQLVTKSLHSERDTNHLGMAASTQEKSRMNRLKSLICPMDSSAGKIRNRPSSC